MSNHTAFMETVMTPSSVLPLTLQQREILFPKANSYSAVRFRGSLSVAVVSRALGFLTTRHEALRMRVMRGSKEQQYLTDPTDSYHLNVVPTEGLSGVEERIRTSLQRATNLEEDGPFRAELLRLEDNDHVLILIIHAIVADNYLPGLLIRELLVAYDAYEGGHEPDLPPAMRYSDFIWNELQRGEKLGVEQIRYWRSILTGSRDPLPKRESHSAPAVGRMKVMIASLTTTETERLHEFASAANVSMPIALCATTLLAISSHFGADDFLVIVPCSGRDTPLLETLGSRTSRVFPLRVNIRDGTSLAQFAREIQSAFLCGILASRAPFILERID